MATDMNGANRKDDGLLLKDIVERAQLNRRTARYVLAQASLKLPDVLGKGFHRRFAIDEAVRLAVCTRLVMFGVPLKAASWVTMWCEQTVRGFERPKRPAGQLPYAVDDPLDPWLLRLVNDKYVQLWREHLNDLNRHSLMFDEDEYQVIGEKRTVRLGPTPSHLPKIEWSLTGLAFVLETNITDVEAVENDFDLPS